MSSSEHVFVRPPDDLAEPAQVLAEALDARERAQDNDASPTTVLSFAIEQNRPGWLEMTKNPYTSHPDVLGSSALDYYSLDLTITAGPNAVTHDAARRVFELVSERLLWPSCLVRNLEFLVADFVPGVGRHEYPAGTTPDVEDLGRWGPRMDALRAIVESPPR